MKLDKGRNDQPTNADRGRKKKRERHNKVFPAKEREVARCNKAFIFMTLFSWGIFSLSLFLYTSSGVLFFRLVDVTRERERFWGELESVGHDDMQARHHAIHPKREKTFTQREREVRPGFPRRHLVVGFQPANHTRPTIHR